MFKVNDDLSIYVTRGDSASFTVAAVKDEEDFTFPAGSVVRLKVYERKGCDCVVLQKDFPAEVDSKSVEIVLTEMDTRIGGLISKPKDYWYEIELNPFDNPETIIGYDEDGAKVFKLFPEGKDLEGEVLPEDIPVVDNELDMTSTRPVENQAIARRFAVVESNVSKNTENIKKNAENIKTHTENENNPHKVTKAQVGLGNVPNVATNDQTPTYVQAETLQELTNGEKISAAFGKIAKAVKDLIAHLGNKENPHAVTAAQAKARPDNWMPSAAEVGARPNTWMPSASDVGARPNTWMPTAEQVGARPNDWLPTPAEIGAVSKIKAVTTTGTDLNDYLEEGWYFFASSYTPTNIPAGANGWLCVSAATVGSATYVKQFWYRMGTPGTNDHQTFVRTYANATGWGEWVKVITEKDTLPTAAPAGYGYEQFPVYVKGGQVTDDDDLSTALEAIYSTMTSNETRLVRFYGYPSGGAHNFFGILARSSANNGSLSLQSAFGQGTLAQKAKYSGVWQPLEWVNPPMVLGTEYRTVERYKGKVVYAKLVDFGALPNNTKKTVDYYSDGATAPVSLTAMLSTGNVLSAGKGMDRYITAEKNVWLDCSKKYIRIVTDGDYSTVTANVLVKYVKD